jgi:hypothetical protein
LNASFDVEVSLKFVELLSTKPHPIWLTQC